MRSWKQGIYELTVWDASVFIQLPGQVDFLGGTAISFQEFLTEKYHKVVIKTFNKHVLRDIVQSIRENRETKRHNGANTISVNPASVTYLEQDRFGGTGETVSVDEFLKGAVHPLILERLGREILQEALDYASRLE